MLKLASEEHFMETKSLSWTKFHAIQFCLKIDVKHWLCLRMITSASVGVVSLKIQTSVSVCREKIWLWAE